MLLFFFLSDLKLKSYERLRETSGGLRGSRNFFFCGLIWFDLMAHQPLLDLNAKSIFTHTNSSI